VKLNYDWVLWNIVNKFSYVQCMMQILGGGGYQNNFKIGFI